jgi:hypothetical protein
LWSGVFCFYAPPQTPHPSTHLVKLGGEENSTTLPLEQANWQMWREFLMKEKELWTQQEVADYFRVVPSTVKNWRDRGLIKYWQAPGSTRVLYFADEIKDFIDKYTSNLKGGQHKKKIVKKVPVIPSEDWRI